MIELAARRFEASLNRYRRACAEADRARAEQDAAAKDMREAESAYLRERFPSPKDLAAYFAAEQGRQEG